MGVYYLQKRLGLSYSDIFGEEHLVEETESVQREGFTGFLKDLFLGEEEVVCGRRFCRGPGMSAKAFATYLDLMQEDLKREKKNGKASQARNSLGKNKM